MILAVDPGGTTGVAMLDTYGWKFKPEQIVGGRFAFYPWFVTNFDPEYTSDELDLVICEDFIVSNQTAKKTPQPDALRIIGYLEGWCSNNDIPFVLQTPSNGKGFGTDDKLKHVGWYTPGMPHATDAARHLLTGLRNRYYVQDLLRGFGE